MTRYESNADVQPVRVTTYRLRRKAARRGWAVPTQPEPSLGDLVVGGTPGHTVPPDAHPDRA